MNDTNAWPRESCAATTLQRAASIKEQTGTIAPAAQKPTSLGRVDLLVTDVH